MHPPDLAPLTFRLLSIDQHKDGLLDIDDCFVIDSVGEFYVQLHTDTGHQDLKPDWFGYNVIG